MKVEHQPGAAMAVDGEADNATGYEVAGKNRRISETLRALRSSLRDIS